MKNIKVEIRNAEHPYHLERVVSRNDLDDGFVEQIANIIKCRCCQNNWHDPEHYHSSSCKESVTGHPF